MVVGAGFAIGARFRNVVVCFAERTTGSAACEPGVDAGAMEGMAAAEPSHIIIVLEGVETDGASVARDAEHLRGCCGADWVVIVFFFVLCYSDDGIVARDACLGRRRSGDGRSRRARTVFFFYFCR